jgi:hypothetical protein
VSAALTHDVDLAISSIADSQGERADLSDAELLMQVKISKSVDI